MGRLKVKKVLFYCLKCKRYKKNEKWQKPTVEDLFEFCFTREKWEVSFTECPECKRKEV